MDEPTGHREREHFFGAAKTVASLTLLSRIFGLVRDMAIASLGASRATAAFLVAFQVPNLFRRLFGEGALAGAFVPIFTETAERSGLEKARRLLANALGLLSLLLVGLMVLIYAGLLSWRVIWPGEWDRQLLVGLTAVTLPFMVTICLLALGSAALNCRGHFAYPAFAPILLNIFVIIAAWFVAPMLREDLSGKLFVIAAAVAVAGVVQLAGVLWLLRRSGFAVAPRLTPVEPGIKPMVRLMVPMVIGLGFIQISPFFDMVIIWIFSATAHDPTMHLFGWELARPLCEATQMRVYIAQRLYQLPLGVLTISLAVAVFPLFSRYASRGDMPSLRQSINRALRLAIMEGLAAGVGLFILAEPVTRLLFVRVGSEFSAADAAGSAFVLRMYVLGMWAYCAYQILSRAFFAMKQPRTPLVVSSVLVIVNVVVVLRLIWLGWLGAGAFGLVTSCTAAVSVVILAVLLWRRCGRLGGGRLAASVARSVVASAAMGAIVAYLRWGVLSDAADLLVVAVCVPAGAAAFALAAWLMRAPELGELFGAMRNRRRNGETPAE